MPQNIALARLVLDPHQHEQEVGKPVRVTDHHRLDWFRECQFGDLTLGEAEAAALMLHRADFNNLAMIMSQYVVDILNNYCARARLITT
jgi:hypothetical protein